MGVRSLVFIGVTLGVLGMISLYQGCTQVERVLPDFSRVGATYLATLVREFGPVICGLMIATRTGSAIAAQVGSMVVTEQVDALRMCNTDPVRYLVVPRFLAGGPMLLALTIFGVCISFFAGMVTARIGWEVPYSTYINLSMVHMDDVVMGVMKSLSFGYAIPIIAAHSGLSAHGGSEGVGSATTRSVVNCSFAVIVLDFMISSGVFLLVN
jgi:phospholipid/cholesterol/gamma-HCH transport system permease protein